MTDVLVNGKLVDASIVSNIGTRLDLIEAVLFPAPATQPTTAPAWDADTVYPPNATVSYSGHLWRNNCGSWLNPGCVPGDAEHPFWSQLPDQGETATPWTVGMNLTTGELVSNGGHNYRWAQADYTNAPANYAPTGTVSTAAWTFVN